MNDRRQLLGVLCVLGGMTAISMQDAIVKSISGDYPLHQVILARSVVAVCLTLVLVQLEGGFANLRTRRPGLHLARAALLVFANSAFYAALAAMPLAEATAIFFVSPLFITALSGPFLGEKVGPWRWGAVLAGVIGVIVMIRPGADVFRFATLLPLAAAFAYALMQMLTRRLGVTDKASIMSFYVQLSFVLFSAAAGLIAGDGKYFVADDPSLAFLFRAWAWPTAADAGLMLACGCLVAIIGYLLSQAYRIAEANVVAPFEYIALPLAVTWGLMFFGEQPDGVTLIGIALIVGSGLFVLYRETRRGRSVASAQPMPPNR